MRIYLVRHGKSDKSLQAQLPYDEFELKRSLVEGEAEKARELGKFLKEQNSTASSYDFVWSGKLRSKQTVMAIAEGFGLSGAELENHLREDFGLTYLADKEFWHDCESAVKNGTVPSHADFFLANSPEEYFAKHHFENPGLTFSAQYMQQNMRAVIRRAIERSTFLGNEVVVMVSHEPVISLCMSNLIEKSTIELGGSSHELEYASFEVNGNSITLSYREKAYSVGNKIL